MKPDLIELLSRLEGYRPPDLTVPRNRQIAFDIQQAAIAIRALQAKIDTVYDQAIEAAASHCETRAWSVAIQDITDENTMWKILVKHEHEIIAREICQLKKETP